MDDEALYQIVHEAVSQAIDEQFGGDGPRVSARMLGGRVLFEDSDGREAKAVPVMAVFKKVTSVREKLRVLEQKINNHPKLDAADAAELQVYLTRCYGSLTTFNFLFRDDKDRFRGSGG